MFRRITLVVLFGLLPLSAADGQVADTIFHKTPLFTTKDLAIAAGFGAATIAVAPLDRYFAHRLQDSATQSNRWLHGAATGFRLLGSQGSLAAGAGLYLIGRASGKRRTADLGLHSVEAMLTADLVTTGMKVFFGRARPFVDVTNNYDFQIFRGFSDDKYRSFPSGHATNAFAFAATVSRETEMWWPRSRWYIGSVMYGGAALVGLSRMYNNQHWASDIIGGAAVGTIVGLKVVKFQHSHPGNRIDRAFLSVNITPSSIPGARPHISLGF
ncbi:MAG: phosphatase PAP2 family protein [Gemmatimonadota bacterium]|nr:phosphatase PAP2 family protein [Gemmatimonadota bacterium]